MSTVTRQTPLPSAVDVRELLEGLLGRPVEAVLGTGAVNPNEHPGAVVGVYVDDAMQLKALVVLDLALAAHLGASIALIPARTAEDVVEQGMITPALFDNAAEILNVAASMFNVEGAPHLRLYETYAPREVLPADVAKWVLAYVRRLDMELEVSGYGAGRISVAVL